MRFGSRYVLPLVFVASLGIPVFGAATTASAASANQDIALKTSSFPTMRPGESAWVSTLWDGANFDAHTFRMTAASTGATISYPTNTSTYSSLYGSDSLLRQGTDFAALKISVGDTVTSTVTVNLHVTYDLDHNNGAHPNPTHEVRDLQVSLPVTPYSGTPVTAVTTSLGPIAHGTSAWAQFSVRGEKPGVTSLSAQVSAPSGITIVYPNGGTTSSPSQSSTLGVLVTDYFGFKISVGSIAAGNYNVTVTMTYGSGQHQTATVPVVVT